MKKTKRTLRGICSLVLCVLLILPVVSVGFVFPETAVTASAATVTVSSYSDLSVAITNANAAEGQTVIQLGASILQTTAFYALPAITGDVVLDLNGFDIRATYVGSGSKESNSTYQIPAENSGKDVRSDTLSNAMITVGAGGKMQIINSSETSAFIVGVSGYNLTDSGTSDRSISTSTNILNCSGTLILGDKIKSSNNNFTIAAYSAAYATQDSRFRDVDAYATSLAVSLLADTAVLKMYGGTLTASALTRGYNSDAIMIARCFPLNVEKCHVVEIYGGRIRIPHSDDSYLVNCGIENSGSSEKVANSTGWFAGIRCNDDNVYIFDVESDVQIWVSSDTENATAYLSNIWAVNDTSAPYVYGGSFSHGSSASDHNSGDVTSYAIQGKYHSASGDGSNVGSVGKGSSASTNLFSAVYMADTNTTNGKYYGDYDTYADFMTANGTDVHASDSFTVTDETGADAVHTPTTVCQYIRPGYNQTGWTGITPGLDTDVQITPLSNYNSCNADGGTVFLLPQWTLATYKLTFLDEDGSTDMYYTILNTTYVLPTPTKKGYQFEGWTAQSTVGSWIKGTDYARDTALGGCWGTVTLVAHFELQKYTLSFDLNGGKTEGGETEIAPVQFDVSETVALPTTLTRPGYAYFVWKINSCEGGNVNNGLSPVGSNCDNPFTGIWGNTGLIADWEPHEYTLSYDLNYTGAPALSGRTVTFDTAYGTLPVPARTGYAFDGWYTGADGGTKVTGDTIYTTVGNSTLYAHWTPNAYTVKLQYNYADRGTFSSVGVQFDHVYGSLGTPVRDGYEFLGWFTEEENGTQVKATDIYTVDADSSLYAHWKCLHYSLTFDENEGSGVTDIGDYTVEDTVVLPESTRIGYTLRWTTDTAQGNWQAGIRYPVQSYSGMFGTVAFTADWTPVPYEVRLDTAGGIMSESDTLTYTIDAGLVLPVPVRAGYQLDGWKVLTSDGSLSADDEITEIPVGAYGNVSLQAVWSPVTYTICFDMNGGFYQDSAENHTINYTILDTVTAPAPTRTAYTFSQWLVSVGDGSWVINDSMAADDTATGVYGNVTLTAQWTPVNYTLTFNGNGGTSFADRKYNTISGQSLPQSSCDGYDFLGWQPESDFGSWRADTVYPAGTSVIGQYGTGSLAARWTPITYHVTLDADGGTIDGGVSYVEYDILHESALPLVTRDGYEFTGWYVKENVGSWTQNTVLTSVPAGNFGEAELIAHWAKSTYDITFSSLGSMLADKTVSDYTITDSVVLPALTRDHYTFLGWKPVESVGSWNKDVTYAAGTRYDCFGTVAMEAQWKINTYTVEWKNADGTILESDTDVEYGTMPVYDGSVPEKTADAEFTYVFSGWSPAVVPVDGENGATIVYTAIYDKTRNSYTVTWEWNTDETGGSASEQAVNEYGVMPFHSAMPEKLSADSSAYVWKFTGWTPTVSTVAGTVTYEGQFAQLTDPVSVTWMINGKAFADYGKAGDSPAFYTTPVRADENGYRYTFIGWTAVDDGTVDYAVGEALPALVLGTPVTYYAVFSAAAVPYTASLRGNGATVSPNELHYDVTGMISLPTPVRTAYTFEGWYTPGDGNWSAGLYAAGDYTEKYGDVTFTAQWTANEYTVSVDPDNGDTPYAYTYTTESGDTLPDVSKTGYTFAGWYVLLSDGSIAQGTTLDLHAVLNGQHGNISVKALWQLNYYTITWVVGGATSTEKLAYGAAVTQRTVTEKTGYDASWSVNPLPLTMPAANLTIEAVYTIRNYTIIYDADGGVMPDSYVTEYTIQSTDTLPVPTKTGSLFAGWRVVSPAGSWVYNTTTASSGVSLTGRYGNVKLKAVWTPTIHNITWRVNGKDRVTQWYYGAKPSYDGTPVCPDDAMNAYTFTGWDRPIERVSGDTVYVAQFEPHPRSYTVRWMKDAETVLETDVCVYGTTPEYNGFTPVKEPTDEFAYEFTGWKPTIQPVTGDIDYYPEFRVFTFVQNIVIDRTSLLLQPNGTAQLHANVLPLTADNRQIYWTSEDPSIVTVDGNGNIRAVGVGTTRIKAMAAEKPSLAAYCTVTVSPIYTNWLQVFTDSDTTGPVGTAFQLTALLLPENATNTAVHWVSDNTAVAVVGIKGYTTIVGPGTATVYCYSDDGYSTGSVTVTGTETVVEEEEEVYYVVQFPLSSLGGSYIIYKEDGTKVSLENGYVKYKEGSDVRFTLANGTENRIVQVNAEGCYLPDENGIYTIHNVQKDITIFVVTDTTPGLDDELTNDPEDEDGSFFDRLGAFFRKIVLWFRSIFGIK